MKISILCENQVGSRGARYCLAEWGLSLFIETKNAKILFDLGATDVFLKNAARMGVDLEDADFVALSHHHWDHIGGLRYCGFNSNKKLIFHPELFDKAPEIESQIIQSDFDEIATKTPVEFAPGAFFLGEIPLKTDFEKGDYGGARLLDDSALAIKTQKGVVVATGCSHSGIVNICERAKAVARQNLYAVVGGFHLGESDAEAVAKTIDYFKSEKPEFLYPMHCVDFPTMARFRAELGVEKACAGDLLTFDD